MDGVGVAMNKHATSADAPTRELTRRQRNLIAVATSIANDLDLNGTRDEQHTAALLRLMADAVARGYQGELVALVRAWRLEREGEG